MNMAFKIESCHSKLPYYFSYLWRLHSKIEIMQFACSPLPYMFILHYTLAMKFKQIYATAD